LPLLFVNSLASIAYKVKALISKSDLIILVLASSALAVGVFRWHQNTQDVNAITIPASSRVVVEPGQNNKLPVVENGNTANTAPLQTDQQAELQITQTNPTAQSATQTEQTEALTVSPSEPVVEMVVGNTENSAKPIELGIYQVQSGDTLSNIAAQYGTDVQTLRYLNDIEGSIIQIGQDIFYPL